MNLRARPILVTGMPRSGTTWLARQLASAPGAAMTGREPMNAKNSQYALGGTLQHWTRLEQVTARQSQILKRSYRGVNPWVYSRYGYRQWLAPWPWVRCVVKDPFAMASIPAIVAETGADVVVVYRHPAAVLASWRRMNWTAKPEEVAWAEALTKGTVAGLDGETGSDDVGLVARMWSALHTLVLEDIDRGTSVHVVAHESASSGGESALKALFSAVGLRWRATGRRADQPTPTGEAAPDRLHNLRRDPRDVAHAWRQDIASEEFTRVDQAAKPLLQQLAEVELQLPGRA